MMYEAMLDELIKIADDVSTFEAVRAIKRLKKIEKNKPTAAEIGRGALAGTAAGTTAAVARGLVTGDVVRGVGKAMRSPTLKGKAWNLGKSAVKGLGATAAGSAAFGATLPAARRYLDTESEKATLRDYLGDSRGGSTRRRVKRVLGV